MESDMPAWWKSKWMIKKSKRQLLQTMVGHVGGEEVRDHGQIAISGEEMMKMAKTLEMVMMWKKSNI